jgi:hydrogenase expression/formation protein HypC
MCLAVPGKIISVEGEDFARTARVNFGGIIKEVSLAYTPEATKDNYVLVHVGFAISVVDEAEAVQTWDILQKMGELAELELDEKDKKIQPSATKVASGA